MEVYGGLWRFVEVFHLMEEMLQRPSGQMDALLVRMDENS